MSGIALTPTQSRLYAQLLTSLSGREICAALRIKPSQLANRSKDVYTRLGARDRVDLMGRELDSRKSLIAHYVLRDGSVSVSRLCPTKLLDI